MVLELLWLVALAVAATGFVWAGSSLLERAAENLSLYYGLPPIVHGAVVVAIGSSFPELSAAVISTLRHGNFDLGVSAIVGSAIFNLLVIPALSGLLGSGVTADRDVVYKEAQFYMVAVSALVITFALAVIYHPVSDTRLTGTVTRPLAALPIALYGVYIFTQYQDTSDHDADAPPGDLNPLVEWGLLAASLVVIAVAVEGLVHAALGFGDLLGTPSFLWGLTVIAAGTSLPDTLVSVRAAREGEGVTSLANVLGSNIFDLLVAVPVGVLLAPQFSVRVDFGVAVPLMGFLTIATVVVFGMLRTELELTRPESAALLGVYVLFLAWMALETVGVVGLVPGVGT